MPWQKGRRRGPLSPQHLAATRRKPKPQPSVLPIVAKCAARLRQRRRVEFGLSAGLRYVPEASLLALAERLTLNEPAGDPRVPQVLADLVRMIFNRRRLDWTKGWRVERITAAMPETWEGRLLVAENFTTAEKLLGPVERQSFPVVRLIELCTQLETSVAFEAYVGACLKQEKRRSRLVSAIISQEAFDYWTNSKQDDVWTRGERCGYTTPEQHREYVAETSSAMTTKRAPRSPTPEEEKVHSEQIRVSNLTPEQKLQEWKDQKEQEWRNAIGATR